MEPLKEQADEVPDSLEFHPITNPEVSQPDIIALVTQGGAPLRARVQGAV